MVGAEMMRKEEELILVQAALHAALAIHDSSEKGIFAKETEADVRKAQDILCWVLGHDHETFFEDNLQKLQEMILRLASESGSEPEPESEPATKYVC